MYRTTGEERYLKLAKQAIALHDSVKNGLMTIQDKIPLKQHEKILDMQFVPIISMQVWRIFCLEEEDSIILRFSTKYGEVSLWIKKLYITGGCGALYNGASPMDTF